jgi:hypothetical protein
MVASVAATVDAVVAHAGELVRLIGADAPSFTQNTAGQPLVFTAARAALFGQRNGEWNARRRGRRERQTGSKSWRTGWSKFDHQPEIDSFEQAVARAVRPEFGN